MKIHFILICEGSSDEALNQHLKSLLVECGVDEATGEAPDFRGLPKSISRDIESKLRFIQKNEQHADLVFIHRDADSTDPEPRYKEISLGIEKAEYKSYWIGIVPVQATEAWLLINEDAIRRVSGRPNGRIPLHLPSLGQIEGLTKPKELLFNAILQASESSGRKLARIERKKHILRTKLISELQVGRELTNLSSWKRLQEDILSFVKRKAKNEL
jgi:hypothetical protein